MIPISMPTSVDVAPDVTSDVSNVVDSSNVSDTFGATGPRFSVSRRRTHFPGSKSPCVASKPNHEIGRINDANQEEQRTRLENHLDRLIRAMETSRGYTEEEGFTGA